MSNESMPRRFLLAIGVFIAGSSAAGQSTSVFASDLRDTTFRNDMRVVIARTPPVVGRPPRVFVGLYLRYGVPAAERPELAHLVEHVTANNQPTTVNYTLPANLVTFGANAMTRPDFMSFWRTVDPAALPAIIPNRANRVAGVRDDSAIFAREVGRVAAETERAIARIDSSGLQASDVLPTAFLGERIPRAALVDTIRRYDRATVFAQIERFVRPDNAVLVVAGDLDVDSTMREIVRHAAAFVSRGPVPTARAPRFVPYRGAIVVRDARITGARVGIGLEAPDRASADYMAFLVLDQYLMGGRQIETDSAPVSRSVESPLGRRLRDALGTMSIDDGRSYETDPPPLAIASPSFLAAYMDMPRPMPSDSIDARVRRAVAAALTTDLTDAAVDDAKRRLLAFYERWFLSPTLLALADHLAAFTLIDDRPARLRDLPSEIRGVTAPQVRRLARTLSEPGKVRVAMVVP
jgi:predicted Zn-dependent peptidase